MYRGCPGLTIYFKPELEGADFREVKTVERRGQLLETFECGGTIAVVLNHEKKGVIRVEIPLRALRGGMTYQFKVKRSGRIWLRDITADLALSEHFSQNQPTRMIGVITPLPFGDN
ncbi:MAG: hypothetical protein RLZZ199_1282 [Actinomycetota bacterium]|jgi:hypothetical protein